MKKKYYVHGLEGYSKFTYARRGPYRWKWVAWLSAHRFDGANPYGCATVTDSPEQPEITDC